MGNVSNERTNSMVLFSFRSFAAVLSALTLKGRTIKLNMIKFEFLEGDTQSKTKSPGKQDII